MQREITVIPVKPLGDERFAIVQFRPGEVAKLQLLTNCTYIELGEALVAVMDLIKTGETRTPAPPEGDAMPEKETIKNGHQD
jgi:hypothetical protein